MSYVGGNLSRIAQTIEGTQGEFFYTTTDSLATALGVGYISDASKRGVQSGDVVNVIIGGVNTPCYATLNANGTASLSPIASQAGFLSVNFRNVLDGGDATINPWQRGTTNSAIGTTATYTADRWFVQATNSASSATMTKTASTAVPGFSQAFAWGRGSSSTNTGQINFGQVTETLDSIRLQGQPVTLSFYAQANTGFSGANLGVALIMGTGTDQAASSALAGTWTGQANVISATQAITATPTRYQFFGTVPNSATQVATIFDYLPTTSVATANDNVLMWGLQLEVGTGATPFEHRDVEVELALCQRYFFQINEGTALSIVGSGAVEGSSAETFFIPLPVQMRAAPTVAVVAGSFATQIAGVTAAVSGFAAGSTHTPNYISVVSTTTGVSGQAALLISRQANSGTITASAEF